MSSGEAEKDGTSSEDRASDSADSFLREIARIDDDVAPDARLPGSRVGRFVVEGELGRGGMGVVYRALDVSLGRTVALKVLPTADPERRGRFLREARAAAALDHRNVVAVYEVGEADGALFIAMALVPGGSLRLRLVSGRPMPADDAIALGRDIAGGLAAAHAKGLVHRDLKPENIMLGEAGEAIILDFGLAKLGELHAPPRALLEQQPTDSPSTEEGRVLGTPAYMSPEQAAGKAVDARSDLFALGVVLYEALSGVRPFGGDSSAEILASVLRDAPEPLHRKSPEVPPALADLVMRCLAKRKEDRPSSATEVLSVLETLPRREQPRGPTRRMARRLSVLLAGLMGIGVLGALSWRHVASAPASSVPASAVAPVPSVVPTSMTAIALPASTSAEALAAYRRGVQSLHDGDMGRAVTALELAAKLDPQLGAAQLRMCVFDQSDPQRHCVIARQLRGTLSERDLAILDVADRALDVDMRTRAGLTVALAVRYPGDAELAFITAYVLAGAGQASEARAYFERTLLLDPTFALAYLARSLFAPSIEEEKHDLKSCLAVAAGAPTCLRHLRTVVAFEGDCAAAAALARQNVIGEPDGPMARSNLLDSSLVSGADRGEAGSLVESLLSTLPDDLDRVRERRRIDAHVDIHFGNFLRAWPPLEELDESADMVLLASEIGDRARLEKASRHLLAQEPVGNFSRSTSPLPAHLVAWQIVRDADHLSTAQAGAKTDAWLAEYRRVGAGEAGEGPRDEVAAFTAAAEGSVEGVRRAMEQRSGLSPSTESLDARMVLGHTALGLGMTAAAIELLRPAARVCEVYSPIFGTDYLFARVHARFDLGEALAASGDTAGACASYAQVVEQWGNATPRSVTAEKAKARQSALHCAARPSGK